MASEDTTMANAPPTPGDEPQLTSPAVDFSPSTVPYDETFENSLMDVILNPASSSPSRTTSTDTPMIPASQLPVPLSSHQRTHPSPIPGLYVTHAHGYHTGGPGPSPHTVNEYAQKFIKERGIEDAGELEKAVEELVKERLDDAKERMERRSEAVEKNRGVERELEDLKLQRDAELRVMEKMKGKR